MLKDAGLIRESRQSQSRRYSLNPEPLAEIDAWLANYRLFWSARLHGLKQFVENESPGDAGHSPAKDTTR